MGSSDYVVAALPMTGKTVDMIDAEAIAALRPNAVFVNIGRGKTVVEPALIKGFPDSQVFSPQLSFLQLYRSDALRERPSMCSTKSLCPRRVHSTSWTTC